MIDVVIVTEMDSLSVNPEVRHSAMGVEENTVLRSAFEAQGMKCKIVAWEDASFDWTTTKIALIRTTWNYFHHIPEFKTWVNNTAQKCKLINSADIILWNMDKHYLFDLKSEGIPIPKTYSLDSNDTFNAELWNEKLGGKGFVVKPFISGGSKDTYYLKPPFDLKDIDLIQSDVKRQLMMIQEFVPSIVEYGETSIVFLGGEFVFSMVKKTKKNDFRVQPYYGGTLERYVPTDEEIEFGKKVLQACKTLKGLPEYARVDFCYGKNGELLLMELELIEPQLWLPQSQKAVSLLVNNLTDKIN